MPKQWDLSLTSDEVDLYLRSQRTVRLATVDPDGHPHVVPLWFVWIDGTLFMNSTRGNVTVRNLERNPEVAASIDDGEHYDELRGVLLRGRVKRAEDDRRLDEVKRAWSEKYMGGRPVPYDRWRNRAWFRLRPERLTSWDFRKIPDERARAAGGTSRGSREPGGSERALTEGP